MNSRAASACKNVSLVTITKNQKLFSTVHRGDLVNWQDVEQFANLKDLHWYECTRTSPMARKCTQQHPPFGWHCIAFSRGVMIMHCWKTERPWSALTKPITNHTPTQSYRDRWLCTHFCDRWLRIRVSRKTTWIWLFHNINLLIFAPGITRSMTNRTNDHHQTHLLDNNSEGFIQKKFAWPNVIYSCVQWAGFSFSFSKRQLSRVQIPTAVFPQHLFLNVLHTFTSTSTSGLETLTSSSSFTLRDFWKLDSFARKLVFEIFDSTLAGARNLEVSWSGQRLNNHCRFYVQGSQQNNVRFLTTISLWNCLFSHRKSWHIVTCNNAHQIGKHRNKLPVPGQAGVTHFWQGETDLPFVLNMSWIQCKWNMCPCQHKWPKHLSKFSVHSNPQLAKKTFVPGSQKMPGLVVEPRNAAHTQRYSLQGQEVDPEHQLIAAMRVWISLFFQLKNTRWNKIIKIHIEHFDVEVTLQIGQILSPPKSRSGRTSFQKLGSHISCISRERQQNYSITVTSKCIFRVNNTVWHTTRDDCTARVDCRLLGGMTFVTLHGFKVHSLRVLVLWWWALGTSCPQLSVTNKVGEENSVLWLEQRHKR